MKRISIAASLAVLVTLSPALRAQTAQYTWVQMVEGGAEVRAIVAPGARCPKVLANHVALEMERRPNPENQMGGFPDTCTAKIPPRTRKLTVDGASMPVPTTHVKRIVIIGDTGCRVTPGEHQDCKKDWPFGNIADLAAAKKPDLIIHVGDYYYREVCANGARHCENWQNWKLDFFDPAGPLFNAAPWVLARGNHETCVRASLGWFRYLDVAPAPLKCPGAKEQTFLVNLDGVTLAVIDSADLPDAWTGDKKLASFKADIATTHPPANTPLWIITHKPPFVQGYMKSPFDGKGEEKDPPMPNVDTIIAGHLHLFGSTTYGPDRPSQLIVGDSGTRLMVMATKIDEMISKKDPNAMVTGKGPIDGKQAEFTMKARFGYFLLERPSVKATEWTGTLFGVDDKPMATCKLDGRNLQCESVKP
ncbi:MAG: metallophosphoesterase [Acidobacteria bacterium]|nr:metallophosphoesterase [Acidobacteriota bacterium]